MNSQNKAKKTTTAISKKYPKLSQYSELSDINLAVVAGGGSMPCWDTAHSPSDSSVKGA